MLPDVVVTDLEYARVGTVFSSASQVRCHVVASDEDSLCDEIARLGARHAIVGPRPYRDRLYRTLGRGSVLARFGVGYDGIDLAKATQAGILCTNTPGTLDPSVAEITMMFIAAAARHLVFVHTAMRRGSWTPRTGTELAGKTVAIIGSGRIGAATAKIASAGFGMRVIGCRRSTKGREDSEAAGVFHAITADYRTAVERADYVVLLIPGIPENAQFMNRERLWMLPAHAWLINTARGSVVDEVALYDALAEKRIAGLATDVFAREPYEPVDPGRDLRTLENVILAPHVGSNTVEANRRMSERAVRNVELGIAGDYAAMDLLNPQVLGNKDS